jgi:dolichyl-phosphate mannosyltransferase polypeptide 2 regulatory subunit
VRALPPARAHAQPFADDDHVIQQFFLPREYAIAIPAVLIVLLVVLASSFIASVMLKKKKKKKSD